MSEQKKKKKFRKLVVSPFKIKHLPILLFLLSLLLVPFGSTQFFSADDDDYFAVSTSIAFGKYPKFDQEYIYPAYENIQVPFAAPGSGLLASPFVFLGSLFDRLFENEIVTSRSYENRAWSWSLLGFQLASYFYLLLGLLITYRTLIRFVSREIAAVTTLIIMLSSGILYYVFSRPVFSHVYEFFIVALTINVIDKMTREKMYFRFSHVTILAFSLSFCYLVRYNNIVLSLSGLLFMSFQILKSGFIDRENEIKAVLKSTGTLFAVAFSLSLTFRFLPFVFADFRKEDLTYAGSFEGRTQNLFDLKYMSKRALEILFLADMGLVFTATCVCFGMLGLLLLWKSIPLYIKFFTSGLLVNFILTAMWGTYGGSYGYRYFVYNAAAVLAIPLALLLQKLITKFRIRCWVLVLVTTLPSLLSIFYYGSKELYAQYEYFDMDGNAQYQANNNMHLSIIADFLTKPYWILGYRLYFGVGSMLIPSRLEAIGQLPSLYSSTRIALYGLISFTAYRLLSRSSLLRKSR